MPRLKTGMRGEYLATQLSCVTARLVVTCLSPIDHVNGLIIVRSRSHKGDEMLWPQGSCLVRRVCN